MFFIIQKLESLIRIIYCEGSIDVPQNSDPPNDDNNGFRKLQLISVVGLLFTIWNTINLVIDIGQGLKLIFTKYFIGGVLLLVGCTFGVVLRRRGDAILKKGNGLLWAPLGQDPEYYFSQLSPKKQLSLRQIFGILFTEIAIFLFQDSVLLQIWIWTKDEYNNPLYDANDKFDVVSKWITSVSAGFTFLFLTLTLILASCNLHWMSGFGTKIQQVMKATVFFLYFGITYLLLLGLVIMQFQIASDGADDDSDAATTSLVGVSNGGSTSISSTSDGEESKTNGASVMFSVFFIWIFGAFFSCKLRQQASNPKPLVVSLVDDDSDDDDDEDLNEGGCDLEKGGSFSPEDDSHEDCLSEISYGDIHGDDVCFGKYDHPGTEAYVEIIRRVMKAATKDSDDDDVTIIFTTKLYKKIRSKTQNKVRHFFAQVASADAAVRSKPWYQINEEAEIRRETKKLFIKERHTIMVDDSADENNRSRKKGNSQLSSSSWSSSPPPPDGDDDEIDKMDVCLKCMSHPGSLSWYCAIQNSLDVFPDKEYSPEIYRYIIHRFKEDDRQFWIYKDNVWQPAIKKDIILDSRYFFKMEQHKLFDDLMKTSNNDEKDRKTQSQKDHSSSKLPKNELAGTFDVCFGCMLYPGTRSFYQSVEKSLNQFPDDVFSPNVYRHIIEQFQGRRFWVYQTSCSDSDDNDHFQWFEATDEEIMSNCRKIFEDNQRRLFEDIMMSDS